MSDPCPFVSGANIRLNQHSCKSNDRNESEHIIFDASNSSIFITYAKHVGHGWNASVGGFYTSVMEGSYNASVKK
uniref:DOMON domain-containing protein n=1 Tax=Heterorhabditis bacteriophora TaxID=37862 RepID=A0A1I7XHZ0_HETBA